MISCERYSMLRWLIALGYSQDKLRHLSDQALQSIINEGTACVHCGADDAPISDGLCELCNDEADEWERRQDPCPNSHDWTKQSRKNYEED